MNEWRRAARRRRLAKRLSADFGWYIKTAAVMLLAGIVCAWAVNLAWPVWLKIGFSESTVARLPEFAFFAGLAIGLGTRYSKSVGDIVASVVAPFVFGAVLWSVGVLIGVLLLIVEVPTSVADWVPRLGFGIGALFGAVLAAAVAREQFQSVLARIRAKLRTR